MKVHEVKIKMIPVTQLHPNPDNPRKEAGNVTDLARSIKEEGNVLEPLLVIPAPNLYGLDHYLIEDGFRRWVAGKNVVRSLRCIVLYPSPEENAAVRAVLTALTTDIHKKPLTAMERAGAYGRLRDDLHLTQDHIAKQLGISPATVARYLALLELSDRSREAVESGNLGIEEALRAIKRVRAKTRAKEGKKPIDVGWQPDHFTNKHHLAKKAATMCDAREHSGRRRYGGIACGLCWETVIRQDQYKVDHAEMVDNGNGVPKVLFEPPIMTPDPEG